MSSSNRIELVLLAALWGASFLFMRIATPEFGPIVLIELRVLLAGLVLLPFWLAREGSACRPTVSANWLPITVVGILNSAVPFILFAYSTLHITGGFSSVLNATAPIWAAVVAWLWLGRTLDTRGLLGLAFGFLGVVILVSGSLALSFDGQSLGILAALFASVLYGIAANYISQKLSHVSPLTIATVSQLTAAIVLLPISLFFLPTQNISASAWISVILLALLCTGLAYLLFFRLIANVGSDKAITVTFLIPIFGMLWGTLFINEQITSPMIIGSSIILLGTALVTGVIKGSKEHTK